MTNTCEHASATRVTCISVHDRGWLTDGILIALGLMDRWCLSMQGNVKVHQTPSVTYTPPLPFVDHTYCKMPNTTLYSQSKTLHDSLQTPAKPAFELHYTYRTALGVDQHFLILILPQRFQVTSNSEVTLNTAHMTTAHLWVLPLSLFSLSFAIVMEMPNVVLEITYLSNGLILPRMLNSSLKTYLCFCSVLGFCSLTSWIFITLMQSSFAFPFCFCILLNIQKADAINMLLMNN